MNAIDQNSSKLDDPKNLQWLSIGIFSLYIISLFYNLGVSPLHTEEPRRAIVALEMLFNNNYVVTSIFKETFYDHPPLWNIILAGSIKMFGGNSFALRLPAAISLILTGLLLYWMNRKYIGQKFALLSSLYYLVCADIYFYFSVTAEIDLFYSLLVLLSIFSIFHFYQKKRLFLLFGGAYFFITLAFFTKGFASFAFLFITLFFYLYQQKNLKILFSSAHFTSILLSAMAVGLYFYWYSLHEDLTTYLSDMWGLTSQRTLLERNFLELIGHLFFFPLNFLAVLFPATLFIFLWRKEFIQKILKHPYLSFVLIAFAANFMVYWVSPGARIRYTYMFFPLVITLLTYLAYNQLNKMKLIHMLFNILMCLAIACCIAIPFLPYFEQKPNIRWTPLFILFLGALLWMMYKTSNYGKHLSIICFLIVGRLIFDHVALPLKALNSSSAVQKKYAVEIENLIGEEPLYVFSQEDTRTHFQIPFRFYETGAYLELWRQKPLIKTQQCLIPGYYIFNKNNLEGRKNLLAFNIGDTELVLTYIEN